MSITFFVPAAPMETVPCELCEGTGRDWQDPDRPCGCSGGTVQESVAPQVNFATANVEDLFGAAGLHHLDCCGEWSAQDLPGVIRTFLRVLNVDDRIQSLDADPIDDGGPGTGRCRMIYQGNTTAQTERRIRSLLEVLVWAKDAGMGVSWG